MKELGERLKQLRSEKDLSLDMVVYDLGKRYNVEITKLPPIYWLIEGKTIKADLRRFCFAFDNLLVGIIKHALRAQIFLFRIGWTGIPTNQI